MASSIVDSFFLQKTKENHVLLSSLVSRPLSAHTFCDSFYNNLSQKYLPIAVIKDTINEQLNAPGSIKRPEYVFKRPVKAER